MTASVVFISYSHDSEVHREQVLGLLCSVSIAESARPLTPSACRTRAHAVCTGVRFLDSDLSVFINF